MSNQLGFIAQQDEQLDEISEIAKRLYIQANTINQELQDQNVMLRKLDSEVDDNIEKMNFVMKKLAKLMKTNDSKTLCTIMILMVVLVVLFVLVFYT
ncbi:unnamed protein product [Blepharisma stoltei]|uniref:t-SNARE coiled-coil homology domain-containing protein n=1 Tax=Blepharisma stoltei TaxID=1481888 RepID=A0AAU9K9F7_9CILI|nr:unnamed protein product [Blepharisma stoltei]